MVNLYPLAQDHKAHNLKDKDHLDFNKAAVTLMKKHLLPLVILLINTELLFLLDLMDNLFLLAHLLNGNLKDLQD